jgi:hypothetical protein
MNPNYQNVFTKIQSQAKYKTDWNNRHEDGSPLVLHLTILYNT